MGLGVAYTGVYYCCLFAFPVGLYRFLGGVKLGKRLSNCKGYIIFFLKYIKLKFRFKILACYCFVKHFLCNTLIFNPGTARPFILFRPFVHTINYTLVAGLLQKGLFGAINRIYYA